ncbi:MAG: ABC transporter substrate-binding protein [Clostridiales bacterium]|nr:ABC transporter substrate-binding protein [Clostridiales bacterium]
MKNRILSTVIIIGLLLLPIGFTSAADTVSVSIDGNLIEFSQATGQPFIDENNRTQVPFRQVLEAFGAAVDWDSAAKTAIAEKDGVTVKVPIGTDYIYKNGTKITNDTTSLIKDSRTYLPIRIVLEAFGADVDWDAGTKAVVVRSGLPVVKIGVFEPFSGYNGAGGRQEVLGIQYANGETPTVDVAGTTYRVELVYADNQSNSFIALSAAKALASAGCSVVLGSYGSSVSIAASDEFGEAGIPVIGVSCTNPQVTEGNSHYFRICYLDSFQGPVLARFAKNQFNAKKAYCLARLGDDYSVGLCSYFMAAFGEENCRYEAFPSSTSDFSAYVANAKSFGSDVLFSPVSTEVAALVINQAAAQDLEIPLLAGDTWDSNVILNAARDTDLRIYATTFYHEGGDTVFDSGVKSWINSDPVARMNNGGDDKIAAVSAMGYDAYNVALEAFRKAGTTDPAGLMAALSSVQYEGITGSIDFDDVNGDARRDVAFIIVCDTKAGEWKLVKQQGID